MTDERIRVGFVGCGGISRLYADIYASLADIAQVVAVADFVDELAEKTRTTLSEGVCHGSAPRANDAFGGASAGGSRAPGANGGDC